ncbi:MAG: hypothetical protein ACLFS3_03210 [Candidatus Aenigmatarchaeota archaeon]
MDTPEKISGTVECNYSIPPETIDKVEEKHGKILGMEEYQETVLLRTNSGEDPVYFKDDGVFKV